MNIKTALLQKVVLHARRRLIDGYHLAKQPTLKAAYASGYAIKPSMRFVQWAVSLNVRSIQSGRILSADYLYEHACATGMFNAHSTQTRLADTPHPVQDFFLAVQKNTVLSLRRFRWRPSAH